ncbi:MAG: molybdenum cofactor biosynthesis protein MoaE [Thermoleophilia bacterium]|jgi:molybdopterin synthase catalytic subunit
MRKEGIIKDGHPRFETWLDEIKAEPRSAGIGMYLMHNGVVRGSSRTGAVVTAMDLTYDHARLQEIIAQVEAMPGVIALRVWINEGRLAVGDDIMRVLVGGDIRDNVFAALQELVRLVKTECVRETELG